MKKLFIALLLLFASTTAFATDLKFNCNTVAVDGFGIPRLGTPAFNGTINPGSSRAVIGLAGQTYTLPAIFPGQAYAAQFGPTMSAFLYMPIQQMGTAFPYMLVVLQDGGMGMYYCGTSL